MENNLEVLVGKKWEDELYTEKAYRSRWRKQL